MRLLFIKLKNLGDAIIMTPALTVARSLYPHAEIDVLVRKGTEGILKGSLAINHIYTSTAYPAPRKRPFLQLFEDLRLALALRKRKYDWIFDLGDNHRARFMTALIGAPHRATHEVRDYPFWARWIFNHTTPERGSEMHRCERDAELLKFLGFKGPVPPMQYDRSFADWSWVQANTSEPPIVIHAVTRWQRKRWPVERWQELAKRLSAIAPVILSGGPDPEEIAINEEIAKAAPGRIKPTGGKLTWAQTAGLIYSCRLMISVDTGVLFLSSACQVPLVAMLGPTLEDQWGPWKSPHEMVVPPPHPSGDRGQRRLIDVSVDQAWEACERALAWSARK